MVNTVTVKDAQGLVRTVATLDPLLVAVGTAEATPAANTLLARLKEITEALAEQLTIGLPEGAATATAQATANSLLTSVQTYIQNHIAVSETIRNENQPVKGVVAIVADTDQTPLRGVGIACTAPGNVTFKLSDNSVLTLPVKAGWSQFPFAVKTVVAASTTATATYYNLV